jgi:hypothetical protein
MKERQVTQTSCSAKQIRKERKKVMERIATWFNEAGIPSNTVCLESFNLMLEAIGQFGPGLQGPSPDELDGPLLQRQVLAINDSIEALKKSCALEGCSLLVNTGTGDNESFMLNLAVHCSQGVFFLRSVRVPSDGSYESYIAEQVDSCIEEVGVSSVVQVVTDINSEMLSARMLIEKRPNIFWTHCAADTIDSMLEDIGTNRLIRKTIAKARFLTAFIYGQTNLLAMTRQFTSQQDLVHVGISYYTTCLLNLKSIYDKRIELKGMFISKEWEDSKWSNGAAGKKFYNLVVSNEFWHGVLYTINSFEPLVDVLRRMGGSRPSMGYIYGELAKAKREIALRFANKEEQYLPIWDDIDFRLNGALKTPLHLAGFYLNPFFYYKSKDDIEDAGIFRGAVVECIHKMYQDQPTQEKILHQLNLYRTASQSFKTAHIIDTNMNLDPGKFHLGGSSRFLSLFVIFAVMIICSPIFKVTFSLSIVSWWELHGVAAKELSTMAMRLLRLTCGSLAYEKSWIEKVT